MNSDEKVSTPDELITVRYSKSRNLKTSRIVRIQPFKRSVFLTHHSAGVTDLGEFRWLIQYGSPGFWYEKPTQSQMKQLCTLEASDCESQELAPLSEPRPIGFEVPRVWASVVLTTPVDEDVEYCKAVNSVDESSVACGLCRGCRSRGIENTPLVYCLVLASFQARDPYVNTAHFNGKQIYKLVKCGSREAAVAEAFYTAGSDGWSVVFSCVMRSGEDDFSTSGTIRRVNKLSGLLDKAENERDVTRIFY